MRERESVKERERESNARHAAAAHALTSCVDLLLFLAAGEFRDLKVMNERYAAAAHALASCADPLLFVAAGELRGIERNESKA